MKYITLIYIIFLIKTDLMAQDARKADDWINSGAGTLVLREINKDNSLPYDSSIFILRLFNFACQQRKGSPNTIKNILIDDKNFGIDISGELRVTLLKGFHTIEIDYPGNTQYDFLNKIKFRLKRNRVYQVDGYIPILHLPYERE